MFSKLIAWAVKHPKSVMIITGVLVLLALVQFPRMKVDTDPENMLPSDAPVRVFHNDMKKEFALYDMVVLGVVNETDPQGAFNPATLKKIYDITEAVKGLEGVISREVISLSTKDNIKQDGVGAVRFNWLMSEPPATNEEAIAIKEEAMNHPMFAGNVVSKDGKAVMIYVPIESKDLSYEVAQAIRSILKKYQGPENYHITGLPVANDQFGVEMFKQMAVSAPLAGLIIFLLMWAFFKSVKLIIAPMLVAVATVLTTMGLLIGFGFPVHIMSSMIPIFLMPIAVLDSVHILSEFFDKYRKYHDREKTIVFVMEELFSPMLFTSLTSAVGFFSLSFSPIPPVQVFGIFVAVGVMIAWVLTLVFIPAYVMLIKPSSLESFGKDHGNEKTRGIDVILQAAKRLTLNRPVRVIAVSLIVIILSLYGISKISVNDNPVRWFNKNHPIRVADGVLNKYLSGTYEAYLVMDANDKSGEVFKEPEQLRYMEKLQTALVDMGVVGKVTSLTDIVKKVYYELLGGDKINNVVPNTKAAVAQSLISFENSHKPDDLWHLTTPDYSKAVLWVQLKSGDNKDMSSVVAFTKAYMGKNPPPFPVETKWGGLTYINVVWQQNMVVGMLKNFLGSFIIVLFMMLFLFRSPVKALISMIPLTITIVFIYSLLGFFGKDYDMPVAVLSALTLGLSIDFAIHFIQRSLEVFGEKQTWKATADEMFAGPGRAIVRNALVVAIGFLPLLFAPLIPYRTVGFFMFTIMAVSGVATLLLLPAIVSIKPDWMFSKSERALTCNCRNCFLIGLFVAVAVAYVLEGYSTAGWSVITIISIAVIAFSAVLCNLLSKRQKCSN